jgi:hypothetical protein
MNPVTGLVRGTSAYIWSLVTVVAVACVGLGVLSLVGAVLAVAASGRADLSPVGLPLVLLLAGAIALPLSRRALPLVTAREAAAGYTTVPLFSGELPLRDPRDGRELIAAGADVPRSFRVSLRPARRAAQFAPAAAA